MPGEYTSEHLRSAMLTRLGLAKSVLPPGSETQVDQLLSALASRDTAVRVAAASALGKLGEQVPVEALVRALRDEDASVRAASAQALGALQERVPLEPLLQMLHDSSWRVRAAAAQASGKMGARIPVDALAALVNDEDESVCIAAVQALGEMGAHAPIEPLILAVHDQDWSVREATVFTLEKLGGEEALKLIEEALQDKDALVRAAAEQALQRSAAAQHVPSPSPSQPAQGELPQLHPRRRSAQPRLSRRAFGRVAIAASVCIAGASALLVPRLFPASQPGAQGIGGASFGSSATDLLAQRDGSLGVNDELLIDLHSLQAPAAQKSYYGWLLAKTADVQGTVLTLGKLPFQQGKISSLYKSPTHQNLLLTFGAFLITEEGAQRIPQAPAANRASWRYTAEISQLPDPSDTHLHASLFEHIQHLLAIDPLLASIGWRGGVGFWLTRNVGNVGARAQSVQTFWQSHDVQHMRSQLTSILSYLDGVSYVKKDLPAGTPLQTAQADAHIGLLAVDPQGLLAHAESDLAAITRSASASADQKALATQIVAEMTKINVQCEMVHQDARTLMQMTDAQLLQASTLSLVNDMVAHAAFAFTGSAKTGLKGALKVFTDMQSLASFDVEAYHP